SGVLRSCKRASSRVSLRSSSPSSPSAIVQAPNRQPSDLTPFPIGRAVLPAQPRRATKVAMIHQILTVVLPVFALIGIGYLSARSRLLDASIGDALGDFVFTIAIPVLIFRTLATSSLDDVSPWGFWFAYFSGVAVVWTLGTIVVRRLFKREARAGVIGGSSAGFANTVLVGIPLVTALYGEDGLVPIFVLISIHLPLLTVVCALLMERAAVQDGTGSGRSVAAILGTVVRN